MQMQSVLRTDPDAKLFRVCRWIWNRGTVGDGNGYSCKLSLALAPRLFSFKREYNAWILTVIGLRIHFAKSFGGIFAAVALLLLLAQSADAQLLRRIFRPPVQSGGCANGQCEVPSAVQPAPVESIAAEPAPRSLAAKSFAGALQSQLAANTRPGLAERHYLRILNGPDSPRRDRQIARMERLVRAELDIGPTAAIDWASVDWAAILRFLLAILPLFL